MKRIAVVIVTLLAATLMAPPDARAGDPPVPNVHFGPMEAHAPPPVSGVPQEYRGEVWVGQHRLSNEVLELQVKEFGAADFITVGTTDTGSGGWRGEVAVRLTYNAQLRWHHPATSAAAEGYSQVRNAPVRTRVGAVVNDRTLRVGQRLVVTGKIRPAKPGRIVRLWSGVNPAFIGDVAEYPPPPVLLAKAYVAEDGSYRLVRRFKKPGKRQIFVTFPTTNRNYFGWSSARFIRVG